jgi:hypothetical protein
VQHLDIVLLRHRHAAVAGTPVQHDRRDAQLTRLCKDDAQTRFFVQGRDN